MRVARPRGDRDKKGVCGGVPMAWCGERSAKDPIQKQENQEK